MNGPVPGAPGGTKLERRIAAAGQGLLERERAVSPVDVLISLGWLTHPAWQSWQRGQGDHLAALVQVAPGRLADMLEIFQRWASAAGLQPVDVPLLGSGRDRAPLRVTADGDPAAERPWHTEWMPAQLSGDAREKLVARRTAAPDLVVVDAIRDWTCAECGTADDRFMIMEKGASLCLGCADLDHLVFLPAGDAALTRRSRKGSTLSAVVVRFSRSRKRYERQGILVEPAALEAAEEQCLGDADARERRRERDRERRVAQDATLVAGMGQEILRLFPGCPPDRAAAIADHASVRGSGRVGRSAAGRELAQDAVVRAVVASVRHQDTGYDELLMSGVDRAEARDRIRADIDRVLARWRAGR